jgi:hypothetical protein
MQMDGYIRVMWESSFLMVPLRLSTGKRQVNIGIHATTMLILVSYGRIFAN